MLAYVFWHWRREAVAPLEYEERQRAFHAALALAPPAGYLRSFTTALAGAPWAADGGEAYEDWYLLRDSAALDPLNEAAISASRAGPHDAAAAVAAGGTAALYQLKLGTPATVPRHAQWFAKPEGMRYGTLWSLLAPVVARSPDAAVWCRQMVLGPSPELCVQSREPLQLPAALLPRRIAMRPIWPAVTETLSASA